MVVGLLAVATMPAAIWATRYFEGYELLDAAWAIPAGILLGLAAVTLARRARREGALRLAARPPRAAALGSALGVLGVCLAVAAAISVGVYGLLEYWASRD